VTLQQTFYLKKILEILELIIATARLVTDDAHTFGMKSILPVSWADGF